MLGMLGSASTIEAVANALTHHHLKNVVLDPVMVSTSGAQLLPQDAVHTLQWKLLRYAKVLTPNIPEAKLLLADAGVETGDITCLTDMQNMVVTVQNLGPEWVLIKGGHAPFKSDLTIAMAPEERKVVVDVLYGQDKMVILQSPYQNSKNTHGTGCSLACNTIASPR